MPLILNAGKLLRTDLGKLAGSLDCCCDEPTDFCGGCTGVEIPELQVDFDATGVTANTNTTICDCTDGDCEAFGGTYILSSASVAGPGDGYGAYNCTDTGRGDESCYWEKLAETGVEEHCVGGITGYCYPLVRVWIGKIGSNWYLTFAFSLTDDVPAGAAATLFWYVDLGTTKPVCSEIFPITLDSSDFGCPTGFVAEVTIPCFFGSVASITISIP